MKNIDEDALWRRISKAVSELPYRIELPLTILAAAIWPDHDENKMRYWNRILCQVLREHGATISKRNGRRFVSIPKSALTGSRREKRGRRKEPPKLMIAEAWRWP